MKKLISVFGPSHCDPSSKLMLDAEELGRRLARLGFAVVTSGFEGIMEAVSRGASQENGTVIGVTAEVYLARGRTPNEFLTRQIHVKSATDALMELVDIADAYVAIGTSTGTMIEVLVAWDYMVKHFISVKPLLLIDESWRRFLEYASTESTLLADIHHLEFADDVGSAVTRLEAIFGAGLRLPDLTILQSTHT